MKWILVALLSACVQSQAVDCKNGETCPPESACDDIHGTCVKPAQLTLCNGKADGDACAIEKDGDGICDKGICIAEGCGDGYIRGGEQCDGANVPDTANCTDLNFYVSRKPTCTPDCTFDLSSCDERCGDHTLQPDFEICETDTPPTKSCVDYGYGAGVLGCLNCGPDVSDCITFGWEEQDAPGGVVALHGAADNDVYAVLADGSLAHYDGTSWTKVDLSGCALPAGTLLSAVWEPAPGVVFSAGNSGSGDSVIRISVGTCMRWSVVSGRLINDVWATSATDAWITARRASTGITPDPSSSGVWHFDGSTWTEQTLPSQGSTEQPARIRGTTPSDVYIISDDGSMRHFTGTWGAAFAIAGLQSPNYVWGAAPNDVYAGGQQANHASLMHWNGAAWSPTLQAPPLAAATDSYIDAGFSVGTHTYVLASTALPSRSYMFVDDGTGWAPLPIPTSGQHALFATSTGSVFAGVTLASRVAVMHGSARYDDPQGTPAASLHEVVAAGPDDAYAIGADQSLTLAHWDGSAWSVVTDVNEPRDVAFSPTGKPFAVGATGLWVGPIWSNDTSVSGTHLFAVADNDVWIIDPDTAPGAVYRWQGSGSVTPHDYPVTNQTQMNDIWAASSTDVFLVGQTMGAVPGALVGAVLHWDGLSWTSMPLPPDVPALARISARSPTNIYALSQQASLIHYDGTSWSVVQGAGQVNDVWGSPDDLFVGTYTGMQHFDGTQWSPVATGSVTGVSFVTGVGDSILFADYFAGWHQLVRLAPW